MYRLLPNCFVIMVFSAFLVGQIVFDQFNTNANLSSKGQRLTTLYKDNLKIFKDRSFNGVDIDLAKVKAPVVILNFWASWCGPCLEEFPSLVKLKKKYKEEEVYIVGINSDTEDVNKNIEKIYRDYRLNFPSILDNNKWMGKFRVNSIPVSIIYLGDEIIVSEGAKNFMERKFLRKIDQVLEDSSA